MNYTFPLYSLTYFVFVAFICFGFFFVSNYISYLAIMHFIKWTVVVYPTHAPSFAKNCSIPVCLAFKTLPPEGATKFDIYEKQ